MAETVNNEFDSLFERVSDKLRRYIYCQCRDRTDVDDIVQESCVKALRSWEQYSGRGTREGWFFAIARTTCVDWFRKKKPVRSLDVLEGMEPASRVENESVDEVDAIWQMIDSLGEDPRQVLYLRFSSGLDYKSMAEVLGVPLGTVRSRLHRALKQVQEMSKENESGND